MLLLTLAEIPKGNFGGSIPLSPSSSEQMLCWTESEPSNNRRLTLSDFTGSSKEVMMFHYRSGSETIMKGRKIIII